MLLVFFTLETFTKYLCYFYRQIHWDLISKGAKD